MDPHIQKMILSRNNVALDDDIAVMAELIERAKKNPTAENIALAILSQRIVKERARFCLRGSKVKEALGLIDKVVSEPRYRKNYVGRYTRTLLYVFPNYKYVTCLWAE